MDGRKVCWHCRAATSSRGYRTRLRDVTFDSCVSDAVRKTLGRHQSNSMMSGVEEWILQDLSHMEATLGILAFGSLISNPGAEIEAALVGRKVDVRTPFGVEFARGNAGARLHLCLMRAVVPENSIRANSRWDRNQSIPNGAYLTSVTNLAAVAGGGMLQLLTADRIRGPRLPFPRKSVRRGHR